MICDSIESIIARIVKIYFRCHTIGSRAEHVSRHEAGSTPVNASRLARRQLTMPSFILQEMALTVYQLVCDRDPRENEAPEPAFLNPPHFMWSQRVDSQT